MRLIGEQLAEWQKRFGRHEFFSRFETAADLVCVAPRLKFWVHAFQDVLRLNESSIRDPKLKGMAARHRREDAGHEQWYVDDLERLGVSSQAGEVFEPVHAPARNVSYAVASEVYRATDDHVRIVLILALESLGHVFFEHAADVVDRSDLPQSLRYFGRSHIEVEHRHDLFEHDSVEALEKAVLRDDVRSEATAMIARVYGAFFVFFDSFVPALPQREA